ncbi:MAG: DUF5343 domain-containing protein [Fimbriimonadaceae bacterium]|nr:DUF5343 domain-containing protein [Alphaproteobacteria bacterium]
MAVTQTSAAPYAPTRTMTDIIERHRDRGLPRPVNADTLQRAGLVTESLTARTLQALVTLDLIDESGTPTSVFEGIRLAPEAEYKKRMEDWLKAAYADVFAFVDPSKDDTIRIRDAFRGYQPTSQQDRMVNLFLGLCSAAGILPEKPQSGTPNNKATPPKQRVVAPAKPKQKTSSASGNMGSHAATELPPALSGLLASLPKNGTGWTKAKRDSFTAAFGTVLDFVYPIVETDEDEDDGGQ